MNTGGTKIFRKFKKINFPDEIHAQAPRIDNATPQFMQITAERCVKNSVYSITYYMLHLNMIVTIIHSKWLRNILNNLIHYTKQPIHIENYVTYVDVIIYCYTEQNYLFLTWLLEPLELCTLSIISFSLISVWRFANIVTWAGWTTSQGLNLNIKYLKNLLRYVLNYAKIFNEVRIHEIFSPSLLCVCLFLP